MSGRCVCVCVGRKCAHTTRRALRLKRYIYVYTAYREKLWLKTGPTTRHIRPNPTRMYTIVNAPRRRRCFARRPSTLAAESPLLRHNGNTHTHTLARSPSRPARIVESYSRPPRANLPLPSMGLATQSKTLWHFPIGLFDNFIIYILQWFIVYKNFWYCNL